MREKVELCPQVNKGNNYYLSSCLPNSSKQLLDFYSGPINTTVLEENTSFWVYHSYQFASHDYSPYYDINDLVLDMNLSRLMRYLNTVMIAVYKSLLIAC